MDLPMLWIDPDVLDFGLIFFSSLDRLHSYITIFWFQNRSVVTASFLHSFVLLLLVMLRQCMAVNGHFALIGIE